MQGAILQYNSLHNLQYIGCTLRTHSASNAPRRVSKNLRMGSEYYLEVSFRAVKVLQNIIDDKNTHIFESFVNL